MFTNCFLKISTNLCIISKELREMLCFFEYIIITLFNMCCKIHWKLLSGALEEMLLSNKHLYQWLQKFNKRREAWLSVYGNVILLLFWATCSLSDITRSRVEYKILDIWILFSLYSTLSPMLLPKAFHLHGKLFIWVHQPWCITETPWWYKADKLSVYFFVHRILVKRPFIDTRFIISKTPRKYFLKFV